jgi:hypothetical protein
LRRMNLESQNVPDYSNRGPYGGDSIPRRLGERHDRRGGAWARAQASRESSRRNGMQPDDCPEYITTRQSSAIRTILTASNYHSRK